MKKYLLVMMTVLFPIVVGAQEKYLFTLENCIQYALDKNYNHQSMKLAETSMYAAFKQAKYEQLPVIGASISENFTNSTKNTVNEIITGGSSVNGNYSVNASVQIYQGGYIKNSIKQSRLQSEQATYQTHQYKNELIIQILQTFFSVLGNEELLKYQSSVVETSKEQLNQGKEKYRLGTIIESDYLLLEAQCANDQNNIIDTEIAKNNNLLRLKSLLSMSPEVILEIIYPDTATIVGLSLLPTQEEVTERILIYLPELKIGQYNVDIAKAGLKLSKSGYYPTISLGAGLGTGHVVFSGLGRQLNNHLNEQIGITVNIPVFNKNRTKTNVVQSKILQQQAELTLMQAELDIRQMIIQEYQNVVSEYNKYKVANIRQEAYLKSFEASRMRYYAGSITPVELLQQQNNYIGALNDYIQSKYGFMIKRMTLDVYMGEMIRF